MAERRARRRSIGLLAPLLFLTAIAGAPVAMAQSDDGGVSATTPSEKKRAVALHHERTQTVGVDTQMRREQRDAYLVLGAIAVIGALVAMLIVLWVRQSRNRRFDPGPPPAERKAAAAAAATGAATRTVEPEDMAVVKDLYDRRRYDEAEEVVRDVLSVDQRNPAAHYYLGLICLATGRTADAGKRFEAALAVDRKDTDAMFWLAHVRRVEGQNTKALDLYRRILSIKPDHAAARRAFAEMGGVLTSGDPVISQPDHVLDPEEIAGDAPYLGDIYDTIRERARYDQHYLDVVRMAAGVKIPARHPIMTAYLQPILMRLLVVAALFGLAVAASTIATNSRTAAEIRNSVSPDQAAPPSNIAAPENGPAFSPPAPVAQPTAPVPSGIIVPISVAPYIADLSGLLLLASVILLIYLLLYVTRSATMTIEIDRCNLTTQGGMVFSNASPVYNIYRFEYFVAVQDFGNMLTGDGALRLVHAGGGRSEIRGLAKFAELQAISRRLTSLRLAIRSLPDLDKGIMG